MFLSYSTIYSLVHVDISSSITASWSLAMKLSHTVVAAYMTNDAVVACLCHMGKAYVYLLFHGTVGSISVICWICWLYLLHVGFVSLAWWQLWGI